MRAARQNAVGPFAGVLLDARLRSTNPLAILARGFSVVTNSAGEIVREPSQAPAGSNIRIRLTDGELTATVNPYPKTQ